MAEHGHAAVKAVVKVTHAAGSAAFGIAGAFQLLAGVVVFLLFMAFVRTNPVFSDWAGGAFLVTVVVGGSYTLWRYTWFRKDMKPEALAYVPAKILGLASAGVCLFALWALSTAALQRLGIHDMAEIKLGSLVMALLIFIALNTRVDSENWKLPHAKA